MSRAVHIALERGLIIYDALFLALAEHGETLAITDDDRMLKALEGTSYSDLAQQLIAVESLLR
jgi:predicted nucleic acid-binding protein